MNEMYNYIYSIIAPQSLGPEAQYTRKNLDSESFSPQRILVPGSFLAWASFVSLESRQASLWQLIALNGSLSASLLICGRNTLRTPRRLFLALLLNGVKILSTSIFRSSPDTVILMPRVTQVGLNKFHLANVSL